MENLVGQKLANNYRVARLVGQGGMAQVYYGWDESLDRPVAIKVIGDALRNNETFTDRFVQEARAVAKWRHENILQVYYAGAEENNLYYYVMEYVDGQDLERILHQYEEKGELIPFEDVIRIGRAVASALDYAHGRHIIHRDIKPSNIMIDRENRVVLTDFGLAMDVQRGSMGQTFGTPHYIAPEQARNSADAVPQSDFYSLSVILYEMLTGVVPFDDPSSMSVALKHLTESPPSPRTINPNLSEEVENVLLKALSKEPHGRYANGTALMDALEDALLAQSERGKQTLVLPPLPSGVAPTVTPPRQLSRLSVFDNVRLSAPMPPPQALSSQPSPIPRYTPPPPSTPTPVATSTPTTPTTTAASPTAGLGVNTYIMGAVLVLVLIGILFVFGEDNEGIPESPGVGAQATDPVGVVEGVVPQEEGEAPPQSAQTPDADATLVYPDGKPIELVYNNSSLYLHNPNSQRLRSSSFSFEALDAEGRALRWFMNGDRWSLFYSFVDSNNCLAIEPFGSPGNYLRPPQCRNYNATVTPDYEGAEMFWLARSQATEFRVLWNNEEVARCPLGENTCKFNVP